MLCMTRWLGRGGGGRRGTLQTLCCRLPAVDFCCKLLLQTYSGRQVRDALDKEKIALVAAVPSHKKLQIRTVRDIAQALDAKIVYSKR